MRNGTHSLYCSVQLIATWLLCTSAAVAQTSSSNAFDPPDIGPGSTSTLSLTLNNASGSALNIASYTDSLDAGLSLQSPANILSTCDGSVSAQAGNITLTDGKIAAQSTCTIKVAVTTSTPGTYSSSSGSSTLQVSNDRPGFRKAFVPATVFFQERSRLTYTVDNSANQAAAFGLAFIDNLPSGLRIASPANRAVTCNGGTFNAVPGGSTISYLRSFQNINPGVAANSSCTMAVDVVGTAVGNNVSESASLTSATSFSGQERTSGKAIAELSVTFQKIALEKEFVNDPVSPGDNVAIRYTVRNLDRASSATAISFTDNLNAALAGLAAISLPSSPCGGGSALTGSGVITLSAGSLPPSGSCAFTVIAGVPSNASDGVYPSTTSAVSGQIDSLAVDGNAATDSLFVSTATRLGLSIAPLTIGAGDSTTIQFTLTNFNTASAASAIGFELRIGMDGLTGGSLALPADGFCGSGASMLPNFDSHGLDFIRVSGADLAASSSCAFSLAVTVPEGTASAVYVVTSGDVTSTINGTEFSSSGAQASFSVVDAPGLSMEFIDDPVAPGDTVTIRYSMRLADEAPAAATAISFTNDLNATVTGMTAVGLPQSGVCGAGSLLDDNGTSTVTLSNGSLTPGNSCVFSITAQIPSTAGSGSFPSTTSSLVAVSGGLNVVGPAASDTLVVSGISFSKAFVGEPIVFGGSVDLSYTLLNNGTVDASALSFSDNFDDVLTGLLLSGTLPTDPCGTGSSVAAAAGGSTLVFSGGTLAAGASCSFSVTLSLPASPNPNNSGPQSFSSATSSLLATLDGATVVLPPAFDRLRVNNQLLAIEKQFVDDPALPGGTVTLQFTVVNLSTQTATGILFSDDLNAVMAGLTRSSSTPVADVCGSGSQLSGTSVVTLSGGSLAAGDECSFDVLLNVPANAALNSLALNTTSSVTGLINGQPVAGDPAMDFLRIDTLRLNKAFGSSTAAPGATVVLTFSITNFDSGNPQSGLVFIDNLNAFLPGAQALGLPAFDVCGQGSVLNGSSTVQLNDGSLLPGGSCSFSVTVQVPAAAADGNYLNTTSTLSRNGLRAGAPAQALLAIVRPADEDGDGVLDGGDICEGTVIPEAVVPSDGELGVNRYALIDGDGIFDTRLPPGGGNGPVASFTIQDTAGCSCEQIIVEMGLGNGHVKKGCSLGAMRDWVELIGQ